MKALTMIAALLLSATAAHAALNISTYPTQNVTCSGGVCTATAAAALLNASDLAHMLADGNVTVATGSLATDIDLKKALTWTGRAKRTLDARHSVILDKPITVVSNGALTVITNDGSSGGDLYFFGLGSVTFLDISSSLVINGQTFTLAADLPSLAADMATNTGGEFALAADYDAAGQVFKRATIPYFQGAFEGLGHTIRRLKIRGGKSQWTGMFAQIGSGAIVRDINLRQADVRSGKSVYVGGLAGQNAGTIVDASIGGTVRNDADNSLVGGLVGDNEGSVVRSSSNAAVTGPGQYSGAGGLVGDNRNIIDQSFSTGPVSGNLIAGGLTAFSVANVTDSYATGSVVAKSLAGGLSASIDDEGAPHAISSYATGLLAAAYLGGFVGMDGTGGQRSLAYWDLDTSGVNDPSQGAGDFKNDPGITGLTDVQLKSALPPGFNPAIWGQNPTINNGYPYLLANPPR